MDFFFLSVVIVVVVTIYVIIYSMSKSTKTTPKTKYRLEELGDSEYQNVPITNVKKDHLRTFTLYKMNTDKEANFAGKSVLHVVPGNGVHMKLEPLENDQYYEVSFISMDMGKCVYTIPYFEEATLRVPNDLYNGSYLVVVRTAKDAKIPKSWVTKPFLWFDDVKESRLKRVKTFMPKNDDTYYEKLGERFKEIQAKMVDEDTNKFVVAYSSSRETFERSSHMITSESYKLDLEKDQFAIVVVPNRCKTMAKELCDILVVNGKIIEKDESSEYTAFVVEGSKNETYEIEQIIMGVHPDVVCLPFYMYVYSAV